MRISANALINFSSVNSYSQANQWTIRSGEPSTLYFQLIDLDQNGLRHLTGIGSSNQPVGVSVTFPSIDDSKVITLAASQADVNDSSIWQVSLSSIQTPFSGNVKFAISEGTATRRFGVLNMLSVEYPQNDGSDGTLPNSNQNF